MKRKYNYDLVFREVYSNSGLSRADIARSTGLTRATISYIVDYFIEENYFELRYEDNNEGKRSGEKIYINQKRDLLMLVEINKKKVYAYITYGDGSLVEKFKFNFDPNMNSIFKEINKICIDRKVKIVGVSVHGIVDNMGKRVSSTYYEIRGQELYEQFQKDKIEIFFEKDSNIYNNAFKPDTYSDKEYMSNVCLCIDEGIGYSMQVANKLVYGINGDFGAIGHMRLAGDNTRCYCGRTGCYEMNASTDSFVTAFNNLKDTMLSEKQIIEYYNAAELEETEINLLNKFIDMHTTLIDYTIVTVGTNSMHYVANFFNKIQIYKFKLAERYNSNGQHQLKFATDTDRAYFRIGFSRQLLRVLYEIDEK